MTLYSLEKNCLVILSKLFVISSYYPKMEDTKPLLATTEMHMRGEVTNAR